MSTLPTLTPPPTHPPLQEGEAARKADEEAAAAEAAAEKAAAEEAAKKAAEEAEANKDQIEAERREAEGEALRARVLDELTKSGLAKKASARPPLGSASAPLRPSACSVVQGEETSAPPPNLRLI